MFATILAIALVGVGVVILAIPLSLISGLMISYFWSWFLMPIFPAKKGVDSQSPSC